MLKYWVSPTHSSWNNPYWSFTSGGSPTAPVPGATDIAVFDASSAGSCFVDSTMNVAGLILQQGFPSALVQGLFPMYIGNSDGSFIGGIFIGSNSNIILNGSFYLTGTNFISTNGTLFVRDDFYHLSPTASVIVEKFFIEEFTLNAVDISYQYIALLNDPLPLGNPSVAVSIEGGTAQALGEDFYLDGNLVRWDNGMTLATKLAAGDILRVEYSVEYAPGNFVPKHGKVQMQNTGNSLFGGGIQFYDLEFVNGGSGLGPTTIDSSCSVSHDLYLTSGMITEGSDGTIQVLADMTCSKDFGSLSPLNNGLIDLIGTGRQNIFWDEGGIYPSINVDKNVTAWIMAMGPGENMRVAGDFNINDGTFSMNGYDLKVGTL